MGGRSGLVAAVVLLGLVPFTPAHASSGAPTADAFTVTARHDASTVLRVDHNVSWHPLVRRPAADPVTVEVVSTDGTSDAWFAVAFRSGEAVSGWFRNGTAALSMASVFGSRPRWVQTAPLHLKPGSYLVTVVTEEPTTVRFAATPTQRRTSVTARDRSTASAANADYDHPSALDGTYGSLGVTVPEHSHLVIGIAAAHWSGQPLVNYEDMCLSAGPTHSAPCPASPGPAFYAVDPQAPDGNYWSASVSLWLDQPAGDAAVDFYAARSVALKHRSLYAVALP